MIWLYLLKACISPCSYEKGYFDVPINFYPSIYCRKKGIFWYLEPKGVLGVLKFLSIARKQFFLIVKTVHVYPIVHSLCYSRPTRLFIATKVFLAFGAEDRRFRILMVLKFIGTAWKQLFTVITVHIYPIVGVCILGSPICLFPQKKFCYFLLFGDKNGSFMALRVLKFFGSAWKEFFIPKPFISIQLCTAHVYCRLTYLSVSCHRIGILGNFGPKRAFLGR